MFIIIRLFIFVLFFFNFIFQVDPILAQEKTKEPERRIIIKYKNKKPATIPFKDPEISLDKNTEIPKIQILTVPEQKEEEYLKKLKEDQSVEYAEPDQIITVADFPNDPDFYQQWGLEKTQAPYAWDTTHSAPSIIIAILDTGLNSNHPDLITKVVQKTNLTTDPTDEDNYGHGTKIAGIAAAITNNNIGVSGIGYDSSLMNVKVISDTGYGYHSWLAEGIIWATDHGAKVINMSLGSQSATQTLADAVDYAWSRGVVLVAAAGNNGQSLPYYPAYFSNTIAVAATNDTDSKLSYSNFGDWVDMAAPGDSIYSTNTDGSYGLISGTSAAAPFVSGLAALVISQHPEWSNIQVREQIESTADQIPDTGNYWTFGRLNACRAVGCLPPPVGDGLSGSYFKDKNLTVFGFNKIDPQISFDWGSTSPDPTIPSNQFSIRWEGFIMAPANGTHTFYTKTDDGTKLWVNNQLLINKWQTQSLVEYSSTINLQAGRIYPIKMEYFEGWGNAVSSLSWSAPGITKQYISKKYLFSHVPDITPSPSVSPTATNIITPTPSPTTTPTPAPTTTPPNTGETGLKGSYFSGSNLNSLILFRIDPQINFNWAGGSPDSAIPTNQFSVRWTGFISVPTSGNYVFYTKTDDGVKLFVNNQLIINKWLSQSLTEYSATVNLQANQLYPIKMEYFEGWGNAASYLSWSGPGITKQVIPSQYFSNDSATLPTNTPIIMPTVEPTLSPTPTPSPTQTIIEPTPSTLPSPTPTSGNQGFFASYFRDTTLTNSVLTRTDPTINFNWAGGSPDPKVPSDNFSARWTGYIVPPTTGEYTFYTRTDDGVRLFVNGQPLINQWKGQNVTEYSAPITLTAGVKYPLKMEYFDKWGNAVAELRWSGPGVLKQIIPAPQIFYPQSIFDLPMEFFSNIFQPILGLPLFSF